MTARAACRLTALALCIVFWAGCGPRTEPVPPVPPPEEDPVTRVSVPGMYGVPGGDQILQPSRQTGALYSGKTFTYRILEPATQTVVSLSGLPVKLKAGDSVTLHYRLAKGGKTLVSESYENAQILMINDKMAWIKKNGQIFFVVQHFQED